jgi:tetratricopeptide (TPR) repeat protein
MNSLYSLKHLNLIPLIILVGFSWSSSIYGMQNELPNIQPISTDRDVFGAMGAVEEGNNYLDQGNFDEAMASFNKALELNPTHIPAYIGKGMVLMADGKCDESLFNVNEALRISPNIEEINADTGFSIYIGKALNHECLGDYDEALASINKALEIKPGDPTAEEIRDSILAE